MRINNQGKNNNINVNDNDNDNDNENNNSNDNDNENDDIRNNFQEHYDFKNILARKNDEDINDK